MISCATCRHFCPAMNAGGIKEERGACLAPEGPHASPPHDFAAWKLIESTESCEFFSDVNQPELKETA